MNGVAVLAFLSASLALASSGNVVCYFTAWTIYREGDGEFEAKNVDPNLCTHVIYAYVGLDNVTGTLKILDDWEITGLDEIEHLMSLKEENPDLKIMVSMGGWNEGSESYSEVAADPDLRAALIESVVSFLDENKFDGFDLYWTYPAQRGGDELNDPANYVTLLGELYAALQENNYTLSVAVAGNIWAIDTSYPDGAGVSDNVDMINVMSYGYHAGDWETFVGHNAPLYSSPLDEAQGLSQANVAAGIQHWIDNGADPLKINLGISFNGNTYTLADPSDAELYANITGVGEEGPYTQQAGSIGYNEICGLVDSEEWEYFWDDDQKVPHLVNGDQWIGYDNVESIEAKIQFANELGLGGAMVWSLDTDDFLGLCSDEPYPLLRAVNDNLD